MAIVTETPGASYTWTTAGFAWNAAGDGAKLWSGAHLSDWDVAEPVALATAEVVTKDTGVAVSEAFLTAEALSNAIGKNLTEAFATADVFTRIVDFILQSVETVNFAESPGKNVTLPKSETLGFAESMARDFGLNKTETIAIAEAYQRLLVILLGVAESLGFAESIAKTFGLNPEESFELMDEMRRRANAIISDIILGSGDMTEDQFNDMLQGGHAPGYEEFRNFLAGDYEYQKAIFRAVLESATADRIRMEDLEIVVDVPDVTDRGTATVVVAGTGVAVTFNRVFTVPPEVQLTLKGGAIVALPRIEGAVTVTGFTAKLFDTLTQLAVTGTFTWAAEGY